MIELEVVTPQRSLLKVLCESVALPGQQGEFQVLEGHTACLVALKPGTLAYGDQRLMVASGYAEVDSKRVTVICEGAAWPHEVDLASEKTLLEQLEAKLADRLVEDEHALREIQAQIASVAARIQIV
ncbi:MAG: ATP synthase F1 subunit epsilon [Myxococcaceae bacterium]|nr:ATP synthase F1 subunit epsilon [Myxococcaceae bacterium]MBH2006156.1 ATP synthase F1 subunit epsilon [Myxococcaceae bacterium]